MSRPRWTFAWALVVLSAPTPAGAADPEIALVAYPRPLPAIQFAPDELAARAFASPAPAAPNVQLMPAPAHARDPGVAALTEAQARLLLLDMEGAYAAYQRYLHDAPGRPRGAGEATAPARFNAYLLGFGLGLSHYRPWPAPPLRSRTTATTAPRRWTPADAAAFRSARALVRAEHHRLEHARLYIEMFGDIAPPGQRATAELEIAEILWARSCGLDNPSPSGVCGVEVDRSWGDAPIVPRTLALVERDPWLARAAGDAARALLRRTRRARVDVSTVDGAALRDARSGARLLLAEQLYEEYLAVLSPKYTTWSQDEWRRGSGIPQWEAVAAVRSEAFAATARAWNDYARRKTDLAIALERRYTEIARDASPRTLMAALLRSAQVIHEHDRQGLRSTTDPVHRSPTFDLRHRRARPRDTALNPDARARLARCVALARRYGVYDRWAEGCFDLLGRIELPLARTREFYAPSPRIPGPETIGVIEVLPDA